jgi:hypothetical protein
LKIQRDTILRSRRYHQLWSIHFFISTLYNDQENNLDDQQKRKGMINEIFDQDQQFQRYLFQHHHNSHDKASKSIFVNSISWSMCCNSFNIFK